MYSVKLKPKLQNANLTLTLTNSLALTSSSISVSAHPDANLALICVDNFFAFPHFREMLQEMSILESRSLV